MILDSSSWVMDPLPSRLPLFQLQKNAALILVRRDVVVIIEHRGTRVIATATTAATTTTTTTTAATRPVSIQTPAPAPGPAAAAAATELAFTHGRPAALHPIQEPLQPRRNAPAVHLAPAGQARGPSQ